MSSNVVGRLLASNSSQELFVAGGLTLTPYVCEALKGLTLSEVDAKWDDHGEEAGTMPDELDRDASNSGLTPSLLAQCSRIVASMSSSFPRVGTGVLGYVGLWGAFH